MGSVFTTIVELLQSTGPYGMMAIVGWAFWRVNEKKDKELREFYEQLVKLSETQTETIVKVEMALVGLREALRSYRLE